MGTSLSSIFLDFEMNMTGTRLIGRETMIFQAFKRSVAICSKTIQKSLEYMLDNRIFYIKLYELLPIDNIISFSINSNTYTVQTSASEDKESILFKILSEITNDYPLSFIAQDTIVVKSDSRIEISLLSKGSYTVIIQPEYAGYFLNNLEQSEISLIALGMTKEWYNMQHSKILLERNNMGTKHFDKDPDRKKQYDSILERSNYWNSEFSQYRQEFSTFGY